MRKEEGPAAPTDSTSSYVMVGAVVHHQQNSWRWHRRSATPLQLLETLVIMFLWTHRNILLLPSSCMLIQPSTDLSLHSSDLSAMTLGLALNTAESRLQWAHK
ncbi:hypothetical protein CEP53_006341 [Fusarium sp. AF-6]|nr:hypothetical protein CEP53_006341 [Fusarium sp. AF-6]